MKIVALDASSGNAAISRTLLAVARAAEDTGAELNYLRLADYRIRDCVGCMLCALGEGCKIDDDMPELSTIISQADGVIIGAPQSRRSDKRGNRAFEALLARLRTYFDGKDDQPRLPGFAAADSYLSPVARAAKRAIIITGAKSPGPVGAFFSTDGGRVRDLRQALAECRINAVGTMAVRRETKGSELSYAQWDRATSMGRLIAGKL